MVRAFWSLCEICVIRGYALACVLMPAGAFGAWQPITYVLDLRDPASHLIRVTMTVPETRPATEIQFPAWNALYQIRDFVRGVRELEVRCDGRARELVPVALSTWRSEPEGCSKLELRYAVYANEESVFSSVLNTQHAFMNFALLLFYLPRERERGVRVKFLLPQGWKLATLLEEAEIAGEFKASGYDILADSPAEAGEFREYSYAQNGAVYRVVVHADPADYSPDRLLASIRKIAAAETALMREVPFSRYTFIFHFPRVGGSGGMEHAYGAAISFPAADLRRNWEGLEATIAHEFLHLWNVKRIRPQGLEPVDYIHGNDTRDLWFCEGVTSMYQELVLLRAGMITRPRFYRVLALEIQRLQERPARLLQSVDQAGREAWLEKYPDYLRPERSISYYNKGALLGFLLDLAIRHASGNQHSLDDVMRGLNDDFAHRKRFFTQEDLRALVVRVAPAFTAVDAFFHDYLSGTHELDYDRYLGFAGLQVVTETVQRPALGFLAVRTLDGPIQVETVDSGSNAKRAGLERGDILLKINGHPLTKLPQDQLSGMKPSRRIKLQVLRGHRVSEVTFILGMKQEATYRVEETSHATAEQLRVRQGWLEGKTEQ